MNIIVIGAGLAGLAAAWRLQAAGHEVNVLEGGERAGGRLGTDRVGDFELDRSLDTLHSGERHLLGWIRELGLADRLLPLRPLQITQVLGGVSRPIDPQSLTGVASIPGVRWRDAGKLLRWSRLMARYAPLLDPTAPERAADLDYRSAADFGGLYFGSSVRDRWIAPEVEDAFGGDVSELSRVACLLLWRARRTGTAASARHGVTRRPLAELPTAAAERLPVRFGLRATWIEARPRGGYRVDCQASAGGRGALEADAVVLAVSAAETARIAAPLLTPPERDHFLGVRCRPEVVLSLALGGAPTGMPQRVRVPLSEDQPLNSVLLEPGSADGRAPRDGGVAVLEATARFAQTNAATTDEVVEKGLRAGFERLFPAAAANVVEGVLHRRPHGVPAMDVGAYRNLARLREVQADRRALGRRLYFAGDHLIGPGAEAAVVSGFRAAADLGSDAA